MKESVVNNMFIMKNSIKSHKKYLDKCIRLTT